jgi:hypothetical protein
MLAQNKKASDGTCIDISPHLDSTKKTGLSINSVSQKFAPDDKLWSFVHKGYMQLQIFQSSPAAFTQLWNPF